MKIVDFNVSHIEKAMQIAKQNYQAERCFVPALPDVKQWPDFMPFAENGLGVAVVDQSNVIGYLCSYGTWDNAWDIPGLKHIFSPMHANGTVIEGRAEIYASLYQAAGEKWAKVKAASHGICLYAHDTEGQSQLFRYGFGMRCIDAIRQMDEVTTASLPEGYSFVELKADELTEAYPLSELLNQGYCESPFFMLRNSVKEADFLAEALENQSTYFIARYQGQAVAFICAESDGETCIQDVPGYLHCKGLYCLPEHRRMGIGNHLLSCLIQKAKTQGYHYLGTDFESANPSGSGFWLKHFTAYTHSLVRRIDENSLKA